MNYFKMSPKIYHRDEFPNASNYFKMAPQTYQNGDPLDRIFSKMRIIFGLTSWTLLSHFNEMQHSLNAFFDLFLVLPKFAVVQGEQNSMSQLY
jgi:hypothetical protein